MAKRKDPFGKSYAVFDTLVTQLYKQVNTNLAAWSINASDIGGILPLLTTWNAKWAVSQNRNTSTSTDRKNTLLARKALTKYLRPFVQKWIQRNAAMTAADIISCGLEPHIKTRTRIKKPGTEPDMNYKVTGTHQVSAFFRQQPGTDGVSRRAKPDDIGSIRVAYFIGDNAQTNPDDFPKMIMGKRSPVILSFNPSDAGKKLNLAAG